MKSEIFRFQILESEIFIFQILESEIFGFFQFTDGNDD